MNWKAILVVLCLVAASYSRAHGSISMESYPPTHVLERDWTLKFGTRHFGFMQHRQAQDLNGRDVSSIDPQAPQNYQWRQHTTVHLFFTQFTAPGTAAKWAALVGAVPLALGFGLFFWKRSRKV